MVKRYVLRRTAPSGGISGRQDPRPEQPESRTSVTLTLNELELVHEALHRSVGPRLREARPHRREVLLQAGGKFFHGGRLAPGGLLQPPVELLSSKVPDHPGELLRQAAAVGERPVGGAQPHQVLLLLLV